jgi:hypothetical protein
MSARLSTVAICLSALLWVSHDRVQAAAPLSDLQVARKANPAKLVDRGIQLYYEGRYQKSLKTLAKSLRDPSLSDSRRIGALQYQAFCQVALGDSKAAKVTFVRILESRPEFRLPAGTAPKIVSLFEEIAAGMAPEKAPEPPRLSHTPPAEAQRDAPVVLEAQVDNPPAAAQVVLRHRHDAKAPYSRLGMSPQRDGRYQATVPAPLASEPTELAYIIYLVDGEGRRLTSVGSEAEPVRIPLRAPTPAVDPDEKDKGTSIHWWIWPVVAAVAVGAGVAIGLTLANSSEDTGTALVRIQIVE